MSTSISTQEANNEKLNKKAYVVIVNIIILIMFIIIFVFTRSDIKIAVYICTGIGIMLAAYPLCRDAIEYISKRNSDKKATNKANSKQSDN